MFLLLLVLVGIFTQNTLGQNKRVIASDNRRDIYGGRQEDGSKTVTSLDVYDLPMWKGKSSTDGFGEAVSATELGWAGLEVWNEAGDVARLTKLKAGAMLYVMNGEQDPQEAYLVGCIKNGKPFMNRVRLVKKRITTSVETVTSTVFKCTNGVWNDQTKKCEVNGEVAIVCDSNSKWDPALNKCAVVGEKAIICDDERYRYDPNISKCVMVAENFQCKKGQLYDPSKDKCVNDGDSIGMTLLKIGIGYASGDLLCRTGVTCRGKKVKIPPTTGGIKTPVPTGRPPILALREQEGNRSGIGAPRQQVINNNNKPVNNAGNNPCVINGRLLAGCKP